MGEILLAAGFTLLFMVGVMLWMMHLVAEAGTDLAIKLTRRAESLVRDGRLKVTGQRGVILDGFPHPSLLAAVRHDLKIEASDD